MDDQTRDHRLKTALRVIAIFLIAAVHLEGEITHAGIDVLMLGLISGVLFWLRPRQMTIREA